MKKLFLWSSGDGGPVRRGLDGRVWLAPDRLGRVAAHDVEHRDGVQILPAETSASAAALALVPDALVGQVARNGLLVPAGALDLYHANLLEIAGQPFWVSVEFQPEETVYQVGPHPADAFCLFTRVRLSPGDPVIVCPGTASATCGMLYRRSAWLAAQESPTPFVCANCGYTPSRAAWTPPIPRSTRSLNHLFQLVARESRRHERHLERQTQP
jgi:hypothetical protein